MNANLNTQNPEYGFFGSFSNLGISEEAWEAAITLIPRATATEPEDVRAFLDSSRGRHFADDVFNFSNTSSPISEAVKQAIKLWSGWKAYHYDNRGFTYLQEAIFQAANNELEYA